MEINPEYSLKGLTVKLKLWYFGYLMWRANSLEKTLMLGKIEGRRRGRQKMRWWNHIIDSMDMSLRKLQEIAKDGEVLHPAVHGVTKSWTQISNWTTERPSVMQKARTLKRVRPRNYEVARPNPTLQVTSRGFAFILRIMGSNTNFLSKDREWHI